MEKPLDDLSAYNSEIARDGFEDTSVVRLACRARTAAYALAATTAEARIQALHAMAQSLRASESEILVANQEDLAVATKGGMNESLKDRLRLTPARIADIAAALDDVADLPEVIDSVLEDRVLYNGIELKQIRVPLGVVAIIYEARPNVTADAAGLALKTANACILRGGSAAFKTNRVLTDILAQAAEKAGMPANCIQSIDDTSHEATNELMRLHGLVDVLIPRGGAGLIRNCVENSKVPVIETGTGNCHVYVHKSADIEQAIPLIVNAKVQRPGVCNACESLLVDREVADDVIPDILVALTAENVRIHLDLELFVEGSLRGDLASSLTTEQQAYIVPATESDWGTEYLALEISCKLVDDVQEAINHINRYGTKHSECIVSGDPGAIAAFQRQVDAAAVYANASTRFTDGGEFGLGAEIGISTQKLHARGPMGLVALTSIKYVLTGDGQVRG